MLPSAGHWNLRSPWGSGLGLAEPSDQQVTGQESHRPQGHSPAQPQSGTPDACGVQRGSPHLCGALAPLNREGKALSSRGQEPQGYRGDPSRRSPIARHLPQFEAEGPELPGEAPAVRAAARSRSGGELPRSPCLLGSGGGPGLARLLAGHPRRAPTAPAPPAASHVTAPPPRPAHGRPERRRSTPPPPPRRIPPGGGGGGRRRREGN